MNPVEVSMETLPFPVSNNFFENTIAVWSYCKNARMLVVNWSFFTCRHKFDGFRHAFSSFATVHRASLTKISWQQNHGFIKKFWLSRRSFNALSSSKITLESRLRNLWSSFCLVRCGCVWSARIRSILSVSTSFSVTPERNSHIPIRLL